MARSGRGRGVVARGRVGLVAVADGVDADWLDLSWGERSTGAVGRVRTVLYNRPGTLAEVTGIFAGNKANIVHLELLNRDDLDKAFPDNPVLVGHVSMHGAVLNSKAFEKFGYKDGMPTPAGTVASPAG